MIEIENLRYRLRVLFHVPIYFYCRYESEAALAREKGTGPSRNGWSNHGCLCYMQKTRHPNWHDSPSGHPICYHCTYVPTVRCGKCEVVYFDSVAPDSRVWTFSLWRGWRHVACQ